MAQDDQIRESIEAGILRFARDMDQQVRAMMEDLWRSCLADKNAAIAELRRLSDAQLDESRTETAKVRSDLAAKEAALADARRQAEAEAERHRLEAAQAKVEADNRLINELARARTEADARQETALTRAREEADQRLAAELARVRQEADQESAAAVARSRAAADLHLAAELARLRTESEQRLASELARARTESEQHIAVELAHVREDIERQRAAELNQAVARAASLAAEVSQLRAELERAQASTTEAARLKAELDRRPVLQAGPAPAPDPIGPALVRGLRQLDQARSLTDVLDVLSDTLRDRAGRVAILLLAGGRAQPWRMSGFASDIMSEALDLDGADSPIVRHALESGSVATCQATDNGADAGLRFAPLPNAASAVAIPIQVGGRVVAVAYVDDVTEEGRELQASWADTAEVVVRHAGRCLESLTALRTSQAVGSVA